MLSQGNPLLAPCLLALGNLDLVRGTPPLVFVWSSTFRCLPHFVAPFHRCPLAPCKLLVVPVLLQICPPAPLQFFLYLVFRSAPAPFAPLLPPPLRQVGHFAPGGADCQSIYSESAPCPLAPSDMPLGGIGKQNWCICP